MLLELLKNAMRATMDKHEFSDDIPPVTVIISDGTDNEDVVIKIADEGGGIPRSNMKKIWSYLFTTADPSIQESFIAGSDFSTDSPLAGLGVGIPISRAYARYFGGDLDIMSMEGFGTDAFIYLQRLGQSREPLPV
jgi:pyruvate dehydrogenase kinase 2/3/4